MILAVSTLFYILAPAILAQYGLTLFCLVRLVLLELPKKQFWIWNFFILLVPVIGVGTFLVCYFSVRKKIFKNAGIFAEVQAARTDGDCLTHSMRIQPQYFDLIKRDEKTVEIRLYDEKRRNVRAGDIIEFTNIENGEKIETAVQKIEVFKSFDELYKNVPFGLFGKADATLSSLMEATYKIYSKIDEARYGAVAIHLQSLKNLA